MRAEYVIVVSEMDPVAPRVAAHWGTPPATGWSVDGAAVRQLRPGVLVLRRAQRHVHDERLDARLPTALREEQVSIVFPSVHRSEQNVPCLTVHPLGNPGTAAEIGGLPGSFVPTHPALMVAALRALAREAPAIGLKATYEATHHGPYLELPSFFAEIGFGDRPDPPAAAVRLLASVLPDLEPTEGDRVALGVGGGHYAPHFTDLALRRRWAFGHMLSRHALLTLTAEAARAAFAATAGAEGVLFARAQDAEDRSVAGLGPRLKDGDSPRREEDGHPSGDARLASGT